jgi:hypothetical protein
MSKARFPLDTIKVAAPCTAEWRFMYGNQRVRFCGQCSQYVYNLSALTRQQAEDLILRHEGRLCVRYYRRNDGTIITRNCPVGLRALKEKFGSTKATILKAAMTFLAYLGILWWVKGEPTTPPPVGLGPVPVTMTVMQSDDPLMVMGGIAPPLPRRSERYIRARAIYRVTPVAHSSSRMRFSGDTVVQIVISPEGLVETATLIRGPEGIRDIAEGAALKWKFQRVIEGGSPARVESTLTFHFES